MVQILREDEGKKKKKYMGDKGNNWWIVLIKCKIITNISILFLDKRCYLYNKGLDWYNWWNVAQRQKAGKYRHQKAQIHLGHKGKLHGYILLSKRVPWDAAEEKWWIKKRYMNRSAFKCVFDILPSRKTFLKTLTEIALHNCRLYVYSVGHYCFFTFLFVSCSNQIQTEMPLILKGQSYLTWGKSWENPHWFQTGLTLSGNRKGNLNVFCYRWYYIAVDKILRKKV